MRFATRLPLLAALLFNATIALALFLSHPGSSAAVQGPADAAAEPASMQAAAHDGRIKKIQAPGSVTFGTVLSDIHVKVENEGDHSEQFGVYVDIIPPGGTGNPFGCTPNGRIIESVETLNAGQQRNVFAPPLLFDCADRAGAAESTYTLVAVVDVHADDLAACPPGALMSMACFSALADDDDDDADNRMSRNCCRLKGAAPTATATASATPMATPTATRTATPTRTATATATATASPTPPATISPSPTPSATRTATATATRTATTTATPTATATRTATATATRTATPGGGTGTPSATASATPSATATLCPGCTPGPTPTASPTATATRTATATGTPSSTPTATRTASPSPTATATLCPGCTPGPTPTASPTATATATRTATATPTFGGTITVTPSPTMTASPTATPCPECTPTPTATASPTPVPAPPNDDFANRTVISALPFTDNVNTTAATTEIGEPLPCAADKTVWYQFTPSADMTLVADTFGSDFDTSLAVYDVDPFPDATPITCNVQFAGQTRISFAATAGTTYYLQAGGYVFGSSFGNLVFHLRQGVPPANDNLSAATEASPLPFTDGPFAADAATKEPGEPTPICEFGFFEVTNTVWYKFTPATSISLAADTFGSTFDTFVAVYSGPPSSPTFGALSFAGCSDNAGNGIFDGSSRFTFNATGGTTYYFQVGAFECCGVGDLVFHLTEIFPPANDNLGAATNASPLPYSNSQSTVDATLQTGEPRPTCEFGPTSIGKTVWYKHTPAANTGLSVGTTSSTFDTVVAVYSGPAANPTFAGLTFIGCDDDQFTNPFQFGATAGTTYYFQVGGSFADNGGLVFDLFEVTVEGPPGHPTCTDGIDNDSDSFTDGDDSGCLTPEGPFFSNSCFDGVDNDSDGFVDGGDSGCQSRNEGPPGDPSCSDGFDNDGDGLFDGEDSGCQPTEGPPFSTSCSDGVDNDADGFVDLADAGCNGAPAANDNLANRTTITTIPFSDAPVSTRQATTEPGEPTTLNCDSGQIQVTVGRTVWYQFTPSADAELAVDAETNDYGAVAAVYSGPSSNPTFAGLTFVGCNGSSRFTFSASAGTTYYVQIGACCGPAAIGGNLQFDLFEALPEGPFGDPKCTDGIDNDLDGYLDGDDSGCQMAEGPPGDLSCGDTFDNDGDGFTDFDDSGCNTTEGPFGSPSCSDGFDNDFDGLTDGADPDCQPMTPTPTPTASPTATPTATATRTASPSPTATATLCPGCTPGPTPTATATASPTATATRTMTATATRTPSPGGTFSHTPTITPSPSPTATPTATATATRTPMFITPTPTATRTPSPSPTFTPTPTPTPGGP